jgi:hypothetical protein
LGTSGDPRVDVDAVKFGIKQVDKVSEFGSIRKFEVGEDVNQRDYPDDFGAVYEEDSIVMEYSITQSKTYYRLYRSTDADNINSNFMVLKKSDIRQLSV